ncbi:MAG: HEAT repeat domain-containing protein [Gemmatimonadota bacterium]
MTHYITCARGTATLVLLAVMAVPACGQSLARRIDAASGSVVEFHFAARSGVCGDGRRYIRADFENWIGNFNEMTRAVCEPGPVRVVLVRAGREPIRIETFAGPLAPDSAAINLGRVSAAEAARYLVGVAGSAEGRAARDALLPASLADSAQVVEPLLAIARDQTKSRELRRSALSHATRQRETADAMSTDEVIRASLALARDESEHSAMRQYAAGILGRFDRGEGVPSLIQLAGSGTDLWLARYATELLGRSGDPRARRALRELAGREDVSVEVRGQAIRGLANEYATAQDAELLTRIYPRLTSDRQRDAALDAIAGTGSGATRTWLSALIRNENETARTRRKAASLLDKAGMPVRDLIRLYDEVVDDEIRSALVDELAQAGTREATAKLIAIAKDQSRFASRRKAIAALARFDDPAIREALRGVVERP